MHLPLHFIEDGFVLHICCGHRTHNERVECLLQRNDHAIGNRDTPLSLL